MPISKIDDYCGTRTDDIAASLRHLAINIKSLAAKPSGTEVEFVIPFKR